MPRRGLLIAFVACLGAASAGAAPKPVVETLASAPAWVREAAARQVPGSAEGVEALLVHDETLVRPLESGGVRVTRRYALRVLKPEGLEGAGESAVSYGKDDRVESLAAWNVLPGGAGVRRPDPKDDVSDLPYTSGTNTVDDARLRSLELPGLMVGSLAAYEWVTLEGIDVGAHGETFGSASAPVGRCALTLEVPAGWEASAVALRADAFARTESPGRISFSADSLGPLPREDWAAPDVERLPLVWVSWRSPDGQRGFRDWNDVARWYRALADPVLREAGEAAAVAARLKPAESAGAAALSDAFAFASRDVRYVSIQLGIGGYKPQSPALTCSNRYGDCKAKSFLLRSLVEPWGWQACPVLVRTSDIGPVIEGMPTPGQFNHCIAAVRLPEGVGESAWNVVTVEGARYALLDATATHLGPWQLPSGDQGTTGLLVLPDGGRLVELPVQPPGESVADIALRAALDENGDVAEGRLEIALSGAKAGGMRAAYEGLEAERRRAWLQERLQDWVPGAVLVDHAATGLDAVEGQVVESLQFKGGRLGQRAGDMLIVTAPALALAVPSSRLAPPPRASRLDLGLPHERRVTVHVEAPAGWRPEALPKPARHEAPWLSLEATWEPSDAGYVVRSTGRQLARGVEPADYAAFRDAARKAGRAESEGVVLVKGAAPTSP